VFIQLLVRNVQSTDPLTTRSKAWVCGHSLAGIVSSKPVGAWMSVSDVCCVLADRGLCVELITCPEDPTECVVAERDREAP
jgi:hypothetical protein